MSFANIFEAAKKGSVEDVRFFIEQKGVDVNVADDFIGWVPLHYAVRYNFNVEVVKYLISQGTDIEVKTGVRHSSSSDSMLGGRTPLHEAAAGGNTEAIKVLISAGADVNARSVNGYTPLHTCDNTEAAKLLVSQGADVNAEDNDGVTPLHTTAMLDGNIEVAKFLISVGANVNAKCHAGSTAIDYARNFKLFSMVQFLEAARLATERNRTEEANKISHDASYESEKNRVAYLKFSAIMIVISSIIGIIVGINMAGYNDKFKLANAWIGMGVGGNLWLFLSYLFKYLREEIRGKGFIDAFFDMLKTAFVMGLFLFIIGAVTGPIVPTIRILKNWGKSLWVIMAAVVGIILIFFVAFAIVDYEAKPAKEENKVQATELEESQARADAFTDQRDSKTYKSVKIGNQTWMAENLNYKVGKSSCYENDESKCNECGRLYDWATAMKACPNGWRLPTNVEWTALGNAIGTADKHGFSSLPCGRYFDGKFLHYDKLGFFWTGTETDSKFALGTALDANGANLDIGNLSKEYLRSVRCVQSGS